jgi:hypothetical protein
LIGLLLALTALSTVALQPTASGDEQSGKETPAALQIGTFQRTELLVVDYGSAACAQAMQKTKADRDAAVAAGDKKRAAEIEERGGAMQDVAHKQLAGEATFKNVYEHLKGALPDVARQAGVQVIVEQPWFADPAVKTVDVTELLIKQLPAAKGKEDK